MADGNTRLIRTSTQTTVCGFCHRGLLRGERSDIFQSGGESRVVCELCQTAALRSGWRREGAGDPTVQTPTTPERGRLLDRLMGRSPRRVETPAQPAPQAESRVTAEPRGPVGRIRQAVEAFNGTEHAKTISGVAHSLGDPTATAVDLGESGVDIVVGWDLCWYRWRVELDHGGATVLEAGRGYNLAELGEAQLAGNLAVDAHGHLTPA